jgi:hypothetical protein
MKEENVKDFDLERGALPVSGKFRVSGHEFVHKGVISCDVMAAYFTDTEGMVADIERIDTFVLACLLPESQDLWRMVRDLDNERPLSIFDITAVAGYLTEVTSGRPTDSSSASGGTRPSITTTSTEGSLSEAVA